MQARQDLEALAQFQLGDLVLIDGDLGRVIGVRYGQIAYDVILRDRFFRNISPGRIRLASLAGHERHAVDPIERSTAHFLDRLRTGRARRISH